MDDRDELLPCPFCGAAARFVEVEEGAHAGGHFIECSDGRCGGSTNIMFAAKDDPKPHLREKWNSRSRQSVADEAAGASAGLVEAAERLLRWLKSDGRSDPLTFGEVKSKLTNALAAERALKPQPDRPLGRC